MVYGIFKILFLVLVYGCRGCFMVVGIETTGNRSGNTNNFRVLPLTYKLFQYYHCIYWRNVSDRCCCSVSCLQSEVHDTHSRITVRLLLAIAELCFVVCRCRTYNRVEGGANYIFFVWDAIYSEVGLNPSIQDSLHHVFYFLKTLFLLIWQYRSKSGKVLSVMNSLNMRIIRAGVDPIMLKTWRKIQNIIRHTNNKIGIF